ncbi:MAG: amino acid permease [Candidatus Cloacimonadota bacterium]|nr:amino acid permease [Candidatus Cloacimonadota bacterium]
MSNLKRDLKLFDVFSVAAGAMISSGLFILPGLAYAQAGPAVILAYLLAGLLIVPAMLSQAELSTAMPKAGGAYFFINVSLGSGFGTMAGTSAWLSLALKSAFALLGIGAFAGIIFPSFSMFQIKLIAVFFCLLFTVLNLKGAKHAGRMQTVMVLGLIAILIVYLIKGLPEVQNQHFTPFAKGNMRTIFMTAGMIFISFGGLTKVASVAEEVNNPVKNIPKGMIYAFLTVIFLYVAVVFTTVGIMGEGLLDNELSGYSLTPITDAATKIMGTVGGVILSIAALLAFFSTANAGIMSASRNPLAMSKDNLIPPIFGKINKKNNTPYFSILITALFMIGFIFLPLETLVKTASTMQILLFIFVNLSVIIMRESGIQNYRPKFKSPLYPWIQILAILIYIFLVIEMGFFPLVITLLFMSASLFWYLVYGRIKNNKESALVQLVKRIKASDLDTTALDRQLREIVRERDSIEKDRLDHIIENAKILDLEKGMEREEFFQLVADEICDSVNTPCENIKLKLEEREKESSTAITESLAIPHIILDGEKKFDILVARCKEGIYFSEQSPSVKIVFVIAGSRDERNFHLQVLAAIAQLVSNQNFEKKWMKAKNKEALRDIILLGERKHNL